MDSCMKEKRIKEQKREQEIGKMKAGGEVAGQAWKKRGYTN